MSVLLKILPRNLPVLIREMILMELFEATADAFGCPIPALGRLPYDERLRAYALFTREQAEKATKVGEDTTAIKKRMYQNAYPLGKKLRRWLGVGSVNEVIHLEQILYRGIGVEMRGDSQGNLVVKQCYYSQFYTAPVCDLISALDDGVFSGLSDGGRLVFSERLTEGRCCCRAKLLLGEVQA